LAGRKDGIRVRVRFRFRNRDWIVLSRYGKCHKNARFLDSFVCFAHVPSHRRNENGESGKWEPDNFMTFF